MTISPGSSAVVYQSTKKSAAATRRRPEGPAISTDAPAATSAGG